MASFTWGEARSDDKNLAFQTYLWFHPLTFRSDPMIVSIVSREWRVKSEECWNNILFDTYHVHTHTHKMRTPFPVVSWHHSQFFPSDSTCSSDNQKYNSDQWSLMHHLFYGGIECSDSWSQLNCCVRHHVDSPLPMFVWVSLHRFLNYRTLKAEYHARSFGFHMHIAHAHCAEKYHITSPVFITFSYIVCFPLDAFIHNLTNKELFTQRTTFVLSNWINSGNASTEASNAL